MKFDFKNIHIGKIIESKVSEREDVSLARICNFFNCDEQRILMMYTCENLETDLLLRWSKLLEYDFFRIYTQHLILYSPPSREDIKKSSTKSSLPQFRKNIYTKEIIQFILELLEKGEMDTKKITSEYKIPKTTLYRWIIKYNSNH